ncbi:hypothetical protein [Reyranella sp.]|uniref:hypothetical protein n=1 Tax=Reyranella sp. TaxID=1929291 RepID=UPI00120946E5|nr:hypothetical protein [Reyranella sp.]TAJ89690.1 MAG: hypothetical protein EPO50_04825 [Reyranella sp.]
MNKHHNMPPLSERLEIDHASLAEQAAEILNVEALAPIMVDDDLADYSERAKALKGVASMVEKARKGEKDQILKDGRTIDGFFQKLAKPVQEAADAVVAAINTWQRAKLEEQRKREREEAEAAAALQMADEAPEAPAPVKEVARVVSSTGRVTVSANTFWTFRVIDPAKVPARYLMVNESAIKTAIAGGVREIDGVDIFEDVRTAIR